MTSERDEAIREESILEALESLNEPGPAGQPRQALDREAREYLETLGLLPYALDEEPVRASLKDEILAAIESSETAPTPAPPLGAVPRFESPPAPGRPSFPLALAAMLGLCLLGLAFLTGRLHEQGARLEELQGQLAAFEGDGHAHAGPEGALHDRFELIRTIAPQVYPLRPSVSQPAAAGARGLIYVCPNHQRWYLSLRGLPPSPEGQEYRFWFMTSDGAVSAGPLDVGSEAPIVLEAATMPADTEGFTVTLEPKEAAGDMAEERVILQAEQAIPL